YQSSKVKMTGDWFACVRNRIADLLVGAGLLGLHQGGAQERCVCCELGVTGRDSEGAVGRLGAGFEVNRVRPIRPGGVASRNRESDSVGATDQCADLVSA